MLGAVLTLATGGVADAAGPCPVDFPHPATAKLVSMSLVQAFVSCGGYNEPNTTTETGTVPSCAPAETYNQQALSPPGGWAWGPHSRGSITFKAGKNKVQHALNTDPEAVDVAIRVKLSGIYDNTGTADGVSGHVGILARATIIDRAPTA